MRIYILDLPGKTRNLLVECFSEDDRVDAVEVYDDYITFIKRIDENVPALCIIRLGENSIPGKKAAIIAQSLYPKINIAFLSDSKDYAVEAYEIGACGFLLCPIDKKKVTMLLDDEDNKEQNRQG